MIRPRFIIWCIFTLLVWIVGHFGDWVWLNLLLFFMLFLPLLSFLAGLWHRRRLSFRCRLPKPYIERFQPATWFFDLGHQGRYLDLPLLAEYWENSQAGSQQRVSFKLRAGEKRQLAIEIPGKHTGPLRPSLFSLRLLDPLGFFSLKIISYGAREFEPVLVLPRSLLAEIEKEESRPYIEEGETSSQKSDQDLDEVDRLRPLQAGDPMRTIHWKVSARMQNWMVRQYERADENQIFILFDLPSIDEPGQMTDPILYLRDELLDQVSEASQSFLNKSFQIRLLLNGQVQDEIKANSLDDYQALRIRLASLPYRQPFSLSEQVEAEAAKELPGFYGIFAYELTDALIASLLQLAEHAQAVFLRLVYIDPVPPAEWDTAKAQLMAAGIRVSWQREED